MGKNNRPVTTATRSISFDADRLKQIDKEAGKLKMGRSEFIDYMAMMYFDDPVLKERAASMRRM